MKIHIDIRDDINPETAVRRVAQVVAEGKVSKNNTKYCRLSTWSDGIAITTRDYRKSDCFVVYKTKRKTS